MLFEVGVSLQGWVLMSPSGQALLSMGESSDQDVELKSLNKMDDFLDRYNLSMLRQDRVSKINSPITT